MCDYYKHSILSDDIVQCRFSEYNKENEDLSKIYNSVGYKPHGDAKPVFLLILLL